MVSQFGLTRSDRIRHSCLEPRTFTKMPIDPCVERSNRSSTAQPNASYNFLIQLRTDDTLAVILQCATAGWIEGSRNGPKA